MMIDEEKYQGERAGKKPCFYFPTVTSETEEEPRGWQAAHEMRGTKEGQVTFLSHRREGSSISIDVTVYGWNLCVRRSRDLGRRELRALEEEGAGNCWVSPTRRGHQAFATCY